MKTAIKSLIPALLAMLFIYAAVSKLLTFADFRQQLYNQNLPHWLSSLLLYLLPPAEVVVACLLCFRRYVISGLWLSLLLLIAFTGYISLVLLHYWDRVPCSCGGILSHMSWASHLAFNWAFLILNILAVFLQLSDSKQHVQLTD
ncbi:MauE/DoxX family redox-associated membrane protein [Mucilaginibacter sp. SJ]|uniref:MauE/DoxX family redox-associated membrane protein n=1 Tax=Mucilaginibacter sp. SJ TaxID=3029053 RepID=UPI0023A9D9CA|nr:MauE/DoxX family redox-associated membrane protein [Mucilaginibacter sp. SJ]WEA00727.1 hypothetical protein MusilaSJ_25055 [Mucilaginibacter sp. SJ]